MNRSTAVIVIGAGIVGVACALSLRQSGLDVLLVDRGEPGRATSFGNVAGIATTEFMPASSPGVWRRIPRWLVDPTGPLSLRPSYALSILPWIIRFMWAGRPGRWKEVAEAGAVLGSRALEDTAALLNSAGAGHLLIAEGSICVYANSQERADDAIKLRFLADHGFQVENLSAVEVRELEPALRKDLDSAVLLPGWRRVANPYDVVENLFHEFVRQGGSFERREAVRIEERIVHCAGGSQLTGRSIVVAAGAWSRPLALSAGDRVPLETERGYHAQLPRPGIALRHSVTRPAKAVVMVPIGDELRVGGTVELAGLRAAPNFARADALLRQAQAVLPDLCTDDPSVWMGHRPAMPDTLPVIGRSSENPYVVYAFGHGHLGLTLAATTARVVTDVVIGRSAGFDLTPYSAKRFARLSRGTNSGVKRDLGNSSFFI